MKPGAALPDMEVVTQDGEAINLAQFADGRHVLVYFYPKADTPGCTAQACSLRDAYEELVDRNVVVFGVSGDSPAAQKAFRDKYNLPFTLIADENNALAKAFGVPVRGSFPARQAYLFQDGRLLWKDESASTQRQADDVKAVLDGSGSTESH